MTIDSISLLAQNTYNKIQQQPKVATNDEANFHTQAVKFQDMVQVQFNRFAKMTPQQILNHVQDSRTTSSTNSAPNGVALDIVQTVRTSLETQEKTARKSLINEASLVDVLTTTTEATNTMKTLVEVRNKFMEAFDKVMNMSV